MGKHLFTSIGTRWIDLVEEGDCTARMGLAHQFHGHRAIGDIDQLVGFIDDLRWFFLEDLFGKELDHGHGDAAKHLPQRTDGRADTVFLDHGNGAVGHTRAFGELTLGKTF
ncbi:hypothetical protein D3C81_1900670 [compost metagenome]